VIAAEKLPVQVACRVLAVSESGYYQRLKRAPSQRAVRHAWLTDLITQIHTESRGIYGVRRIHAELTLSRGVTIGHGQVELLMQRAGLQGVTGRPTSKPGWKQIKPDNTASDNANRVRRDFARNGPNQLWVTDIERHEALLNRAVVKGHRHRSVAADRLKLGAARPRRREGGREAAPTTTERVSRATAYFARDTLPK
jgi:transposase InsO family protein